MDKIPRLLFYMAGVVSWNDFAGCLSPKLKLFLGNLIGPPSSAIYRNSKAIFFDEKLRMLVGIDFYIRTLQGNGAFAYSEEPLGGYYRRKPTPINP
jgi:hypothetical protein